MEFTINGSLPRVPHKKHWQFCVGSGHALLALRTDYTRQLKYIHDALGIDRVRFHGIFCDDMRTCNDLSMQMDLPGAEAFTEYNFNACGVAYDNVLAAGMKPFVELSFMPGKLAIRDGRPLAGGFESWQEHLRQAGEALAREKEKTFLAGYRAATPDKSETTDIPDNLFRKNAARTHEQAQGLPLYYTEWNENAIFSAYTNDTRKVAAYDVKMALAVADHVTGSSIWCFSDVFEELHPFPQEFHGGFGMLTQNGIPKPVFYAMKLLADAPDTRIDLGPEAFDGEVGAAAFEGDGKTHVILFRQKMKQLDLPKEEAVIHLACAKKPASVTVRRVDEEHGNPLKLWEEMGKPISLNRAEVEDLKTRSAVQAEEWPFTWQDGMLTIRAELGVNDVYGFVIR